MANDIDISIRVSNDTGAGLAAVNTSLQSLKTRANEAGDKLGTLATKAAAATLALQALKVAADGAGDSLRELRRRAEAAGTSMRDLRDGTTGTNNALRSFNTRAQTANTRLGDLSSQTRTLRSDTDDLDASMRRLTTTMGGLRGNVGTLRTSTAGAGNGMQRLRAAAIALSPALIPIAAAAVPIAAGLGAASIAVGAFGLAIGGQVAGMLKAAEAEKKYRDAVKQHGKSSEQAAKAEAEHLRQVKELDPATRRAAAALGVFKDEYTAWSTSLAGDTMPVVTKGLAVFGGLLPRLTPLVRGTSTELDRLMTVLGGGVNSSGFERFMNSFSEFASGALSKATDGLVKFMRARDANTGSGGLSEFMQYAKENGPLVADTLSNLGRALAHLVAAASETGVGLLSVINAFASLVNAIPTEALGALLQFVIVFKAVKLAAAGLGGAGGAMAAFGTSLAAMQAASIAAGGGLTGLAAAFGVLSRAAKVAVIGTGIGLLVVALSELANIGKRAPVDVDKMATSLGQFAKSGKLSGEALRISGKDFKAFDEAMSGMVKRGTWDKMQQGFTRLFGQDSTPVKRWKEDLDGIDKGLEQLVKDGNADLAAAALKRYVAHAKENGHSSEEVTRQLGDYRSALADLAFEQQLVADSMGIFGAQAMATSEKLAAQKQSAEGLRQAILALNEVNRSAYDAQIGFESSLDSLTASFKEHGATLNLDTEAGRLNGQAMSQAAKAHDEMLGASIAAGDSLGSMTQKSDELRASMMRLALEAFDGNKAKATEYVNTLLGAPGEIKTMVRLEKEEAVTGLQEVKSAIAATPGAKSIKVSTLNAAAIAALEAVGLKTRRLPDGRTEVFTSTGQSLGAIGAVSRALAGLDGRTATTYVRVVPKGSPKGLPNNPFASGGLVRGYASGGEVQAYPDGGMVRGPGSGTSDSILALFSAGLARISNTEYVMKAAAVEKYGVKFMDAVNSGKLKVAGFAKGGKVTGAEKQARRDAWGDLTVSRFGHMAGYQRSEFGATLGSPGGIGPLVNALNQWRSIIMKATHGKTEKSLLKQLDSTGKGLIKHEKNLEKVNKQLDSAKSKLSDLKNAASQLAASVKSNILNSANITRGAGGDKAVTTAGIMGGLLASRDKAAAFAQALKDLKAKGLSKDLLQQVAEAGTEGGGLETATALLGSSSSEIKTMNALQAEIGKAASSAGKTTADALYGAQIKLQEKFVKQLQGEQSKLTKAMDRLTKAMEKAIEKAFKGKASGGIIGAAASGGIRSGMTWVGEQGPELVRLPVGSRVHPASGSRRAWDSMLNSGPGGGSGPVVIELRSSGSDIDEFLLKLLRRAINVRGGNAQIVLTGKKG